MPQLRPWDFTGTAAFQVVEVSAAALRTCVPELPGVAVPATLSGAVGYAPGDFIHLQVVTLQDVVNKGLVKRI